MLSKNLLDELNLQIKYELESAHYYHAMQTYFDSNDLPGFANFFKVQAQEERFHADKFYGFVYEMGGDVELTSLDLVGKDFSSPLDIFEKALEHEKFVTSRIYHLMDIAMEEKEYATQSMLKWFIDEQVEEEDSMKTKVAKLKRIGDNPNALYQMDADLGGRVFTEPAAE
ncbi:ferritin [Dethiosulfatibacter aminovorans DSM 17477]|uniref:Ferritin n=1 Tax=Dethiosulfatibacter aminovorans DSM 17477 TaxID=1121476 RepID=A0A1M6ID59_9FIRM|nr:ferritin [Dethiosulfatibacter aminovorans]SHJ32398.1 ferritin [Dethiosulfatibacter aminovorans DSM 17477]